MYCCTGLCGRSSELHEDIDGVDGSRSKDSHAEEGLGGQRRTSTMYDLTDQGELIYTPPQEAMDEAIEIIEQVYHGANMKSILRAQYSIEPQFSMGKTASIEEGKSLMMVLTDLEPDDCMAIAQILQLHLQTDPNMAEPLLVFNTKPQSKLTAKELEKKLLVAELSLGFDDIHMLSPSPKFMADADTKAVRKPSDSSTKDKQRRMSWGQIDIVSNIADEYPVTLNAIVHKLRRYSGQTIYLYIMAPGYGNIAAIVSALKEKGAWPLPTAKWEVSLYSGSFNIRCMSREDLAALEEIMQHSEKPLLDVAKYTFFGSEPQPPVSESSQTFAMKGFAGYISECWPLLAAALKLLNDEINERLVAPDHHKLFKNERLDADEEQRFKEIASLYNPGDADAIRAYTEALWKDDDLFGKVASFKRSTVHAFAVGGCDSPLCDQLLFLHSWLRAKKVSCLGYIEGKWIVDEKKGFTTIEEGSKGGIQAMQPFLRIPWDESSLMTMREALSVYFKLHLENLKAGFRSRSLTNQSRPNYVKSLMASADLRIEKDRLEKLLKLLDDEEWTHSHLGFVIKSIGTRTYDMPAFQDAIAAILKDDQLLDFVKCLRKLRDQFHNLLDNLTDGNSSIRAEATWILGEAAAADPELGRVVIVLLFFILQSDKHCRAEAAKALVKLRGNSSKWEEAIGAALLKTLDVHDVNSFREAARSLGILGLSGCIPRLLQALKTDRVAEKRQIAAQMLGKFVVHHLSFAAQVAPALIQTLQDDQSPQVQAAAAKALGMLAPAGETIATEACGAIKLALAKATSLDLRIDLITALSSLAQVHKSLIPEILKPIKDIALGDAQLWKLRVAAVKALGVLDEYEIISQVLQSAPNDDIRAWACTTLGQIAKKAQTNMRLKCSSEIAKSLSNALKTEASTKVKRSCTGVLSSLGEKCDVLLNSDGKYLAFDHIREALEGGDTILFKGRWLLNQCRKGIKLPRRQLMPDEAIWGVQDVIDKVDMHEGDYGDKVQIVAISYCWHTAEHPDPHREQLYKLCRIVEQLLVKSSFDDDYGISDLAIFLDFCSLYQPERTDAENESFFRALGSINLWYAHKMTVVWLMTVVPFELPQYEERGWPSFERAICELVPATDGVFDIGKMNSYCVYFGKKGEKGTGWRCQAGRHPPKIPEQFNEDLKEKHFTDSSDHEFVMKKYESTFHEVMGSAQMLSYGGLSWGNKAAKSVAESLPFCEKLRDLYLDRNKIGDGGATSLAKTIPNCIFLQKLWLGGNIIGDIGVKSIAQAIPLCKSLANLGLFQNRISDGGAAMLADRLATCSNLAGLGLAENFIGDQGACQLAEVLPMCEKLSFFDVSKNVIGYDGAIAFANKLPQTRLHVIILRENNYTEEAAKELARIVPNCPHLKWECKKELSGLFVNL